MLNILLDPDIERRLSALARHTGRAEDDLVRELIQANIEGLEDRSLASQTIAEGGLQRAGDQVRTALGLDL